MGCTLITLLALAIACSACGGSSTTSEVRSTSRAVVVPQGWKSYGYGNASISVPSSWTVRHDTGCPDGTSVGSLLLGAPKGIENCPEIPASVDYVAVVSLPPGTTAGERVPTLVNGIPVYRASKAPGVQEWIVPSLHVEVGGMGPDVTQILGTLRRRS